VVPAQACSRRYVRPIDPFVQAAQDEIDELPEAISPQRGIHGRTIAERRGSCLTDFAECDYPSGQRSRQLAVNNTSIVLIHSPLVGPLTWAPVSRHLRRHGRHTIVPRLRAVEGEAAPVWAQYGQEVASVVTSLPAQQEFVLVAHSGAGPLLPAVAAWSPVPVAGYLFVDAGLPHGGKSWLHELESSLPEGTAAIRQTLEAGGRWPEWTDDDLREVIPDDGVRRSVLAELQPRALAYFTEVMPPFASFPDAPCGYLKLSAAYQGPAYQAQQQGWPYREIEAGHFHMLVDPEGVAALLLELILEVLGREMSSGTDRSVRPCA